MPDFECRACRGGGGYVLIFVGGRKWIWGFFVFFGWVWYSSGFGGCFFFDLFRVVVVRYGFFIHAF